VFYWYLQKKSSSSQATNTRVQARLSGTCELLFLHINSRN